MSDSLPEKTLGDHLHLAARTIIAAIPGFGGPALQFFNAVIVPPLERRRSAWLNELLRRLERLEEEKGVKIEALAENEEFISAVMQATTIAVRNHQQEKIDALRNAVINSALGQCPSDVKSAMFLGFIDQFTVWHLTVLKSLWDFESQQGENRTPKTSVKDIADLAVRRIPDLQPHRPLAELVVEDLCQKGLLFWSGGPYVTYISHGTSQVSQLGKEFLAYISVPPDARGT